MQQALGEADGKKCSINENKLNRSALLCATLPNITALRKKFVVLLHGFIIPITLAVPLSVKSLPQFPASLITNTQTMTLYEFLRSGEMEQIEAFWAGIFIGQRSDGAFAVECRQIDDFYVEYKILGGHYIDMCAFKNTDLLQPYLGQIDISSLRDFIR